MNLKDLNEKLSSLFSPVQVGYIAKYVEPVSHFTTLDTLKKIFIDDETITSVPVEYEGRVTGLIHREKIMKKGLSAIDSLLGTSVDKLLDDKAGMISANDYVENVLKDFLSMKKEKLYDDFIILYNRDYLGVCSVINLINQATYLRSEDLQRAKSIQQKLMEKWKIDDSDVLVKTFIKMAHELGGDYYQQLRINEDVELISCYDVSGKNISASLSTSMIGTFFSTLKMTGILKLFTPIKILIGLNRLIHSQVPVGMFITSVFIFINKKTNDIEIYNLGYCKPFFIFSENGAITYKMFGVNFPPLGIDPTVNYETGKEVVPIKHQSEIFLYSDGIEEARNTFGDMYGEKRLQRFISTRDNMDPDSFIDGLNKELSGFVGDAPQSDDITMMLIKFK